MIKMQKRKLLTLAILCLGFVACNSSNQSQPTQPLPATCSPSAQHNTESSVSMLAMESIESIVQSEPNDHVQLILKVKSVARELQNLRADLVQAHANSANVMGKILIQAVTSELISVDIPKNSPALQLLTKKVDEGSIYYAERDFQTFHTGTTVSGMFNDPDLAKQWAQAKMHTLQAWNVTEGAPNFVVALVDTGADYQHKDLKNSIWRNQKEIVNGLDDDANGFVDDIYGYDFANNRSDPMADDTPTFHGTHVAGTIAASLNNGYGGAGVAPNVKIMILKYLDQFGSGRTSGAIRAIDYAIENGAKIINNSWGSYGRSQALQDEIEKARQHNILFVAAAGNGDTKGRGVDLDRTAFYPAAFPNDNIVSVAASDESDRLTAWSNFGLNQVDVAAPGDNIWSTRNGDRYASLSGTSMATPAVTGVLSLIWSANLKLNYLDVKKILLASVDPVPSMLSKIKSGGRVNAETAVMMAVNAVPNSSPGLPPGTGLGGAPGSKPGSSPSNGSGGLSDGSNGNSKDCTL